MELDDTDFDIADYEGFQQAVGGGPPIDLPMQGSTSVREVRLQARERSAQIFQDWNLLREILDRHEATILKRWTKKTKNQRVEMLLSAWPNMSASHRPDFTALRRENAHDRVVGTKFKDAFMWPYINLEDLSKPKALPLFLNARARDTPGAFAWADENAAHLGFVTNAIVPLFLNEHTMMFTDRNSAQHYGELIAWDDNEDAFEWLHSGVGAHPGQGLIILEIQQRILRFLVDCCGRIMHDVPAEKLASDEYPCQPPPSLSRETANGFNSLALMAAETPYRPPASLDLERLTSLFQAKMSAAEDHIWALREDPAYFAACLQRYKEHRQELVKDHNGREHALFIHRREEILWNRVIGNLIAGAYLLLEVYHELHAQLKSLQWLRTKHDAEISIGKALPGPYLDAMLKFRHYLLQATKGPTGLLKHHAAASPPLRSLFVREPVDDPASTKLLLSTKPNLKMSKVESELLMMFRILWEDGGELFLLGLTNVVDELERLVQNEPHAKEKISTYIADVIGDLAVFAEALRQLNIYQPWAQTFEELLVDKEEGIRMEFAERTKYWSYFTGITDGPHQSTIVRLGDPSGRKFYYPVDKRRTKDNVEAMRAAEKHLDEFWSAFDRNLRSKAGEKLDGTALYKLLSQPRDFQRTPPWVEPDRTLAQRKEKADVDVIRKPLSELYFDLEHRTERTVDRSQEAKASTVKAKTRGIPTASSEEPVRDAANFAPAVAVAPQPTFAVDARALKVFNTLFYTPSLNATPGEVAWTDFLHAMVSTGFVPEKLYGSVWHFQPTNLDVERSIQFHEPHPSGKVPYKTARRFGRRLNRAYGWFGGMFVLKPKDGS